MSSPTPPKRPKRKQKRRTTEQYLALAKELSPLIPSVRKYKRRKTLKPQEKAAITRAAKKVSHAYNLRPVNKLIAKEFKSFLFAPGVQAIQFNNISSTAQIKRVKKDIYVVSNGNTWIYWKLPSIKSKDILEDGAEDVFDGDFDIENILAKAKIVFKDPKVRSIALWTKQGRSNDTFATLFEFEQWIYQSWHKYKDTELWMVGLAILLK